MQTYFLEAYAQLLHDAVFVEGLYPLESRTSNGAKTNVIVRPLSEETLVPNLDRGCERFLNLLIGKSKEYAEPEGSEYEGVQEAISDALGCVATAFDEFCLFGLYY